MTAAVVKLSSSDVEIATRAAENFTRIYYKAYDSNNRLNDIPQFYRESSSLVWNGKPFQGATGIRDLLEKMPVTKHDIQSFDCHPIPGSYFWTIVKRLRLLKSSTGTSPPSLLVCVSGSVVHGNPTNITARNPEGRSRVFSQTFMLVPDSNAPATKPGELAKYYVSADAIRFVG
ncbi:hypothetical protein C0991_007576 [Blastosporella zonata]|nr:hypothetical protein C0991_007576 [Blastosporella zonata]